MKIIYQYIIDHHREDSSLVLATVTRTKGSTPQKPGSSALFGDNGLLYGTVGGGIVEGNVQKLAIMALASKESCHFCFNLSNDISKTEEAICGGQISILVDANVSNSIPVFEQIKKSMEKRVPGVLISMVTVLNEKVVLINRYWMSLELKPAIPEGFMSVITTIADSQISSGDESDFREVELSLPDQEPSSLFFLEPVFPPCHLVIAGAGHIGRALSHLGKLLNFEVTVADNRPEFANSDNIPDAEHIIVEDIGIAIRNIKKDINTFIVIVTRGHKDDSEALKSCIGSEHAYTGMIGSKNKISAMRKNFLENNWATEDQWNAIYAPVGLDIKSQTVEEIAVSIAAQLVLVRNRRKERRSDEVTEGLRDR